VWEGNSPRFLIHHEYLHEIIQFSGHRVRRRVRLEAGDRKRAGNRTGTGRPGLYQAPTRREHGTAGFLCALPYRSFVPKRVELKIGDESIANHTEDNLMNNIIYIVGLVVIVLVVLSFLGLR
jgi:small-conductance mechanosensitive channel